MRPIVLLAAFLLAATPAFAHAILVQSDPRPGGQVKAGVVTLSLRYNSRIDRARSRLTLNAADKTQTVLKIEPDGPDDVLTATSQLASGAYVLRWQVLAVDGHITRGDLPFSVTDR